LKKDWNVEWDASRLWLEDFKEKGGEFKLTGGAVSADDVAEFLQRLTTADHFTGVELDFVQAASDKSSRLVDFSLTGKILYAGGAQASKSKGS
jgi:hypothetical protein